jgi:hypothetical protein
MLDPNERNLYINALRPPYGFSLDRAVGTTYTLNLLTLLTIPLSFAKFEVKNKDDILKNPISILEAVRRSVGKFYVFCQTGGIKVPASPHHLFQYLEKIIIEVKPPHPEAIFHPKVWILRFVDSSGESVFYRFLCLSRNITFDKSWDTILTLEGDVRKRHFSKNRPLAEFLESLPGLSKSSITQRVRKDIEEMTEEIRHVDFKSPEHFDDFHFCPMGLRRSQKSPIMKNYCRMLVVSPFLTDEILKKLALEKSNNILISRMEELDALMPETREKFDEIYVLDDAAGEGDETSIEISSEAARKSEIDSESDLSGLHAKLYVAESGWKAHVWTGSANATFQAFEGANVEFIVELEGKKSKVGIDRFLAKKEGSTTFRNLLTEYQPPERAVKENERQKALERRLDKIQRQLANNDFLARVSYSGNEKTYELILDTRKKIRLRDADNVECRIWPITLKSHSAVNINLSRPEFPLIFRALPLDQLTSLVAFELKVGGIAKSFVLNLPIKGFPSDREERLLQTLISTRENFLRYLLLLLYEGESSYLAALMNSKLKDLHIEKRKDWLFGEEMPLFEELVRAYSRFPEKIERISELILDLSKTEEGQKVLPDEFLRLWSAFQRRKRG